MVKICILFRMNTKTEKAEANTSSGRRFLLVLYEQVAADKSVVGEQASRI